MNKLAILLGIFLFLLPLSVQAAQTQQAFNKIPIFPLYRETLAANTNYTYTMSINPPDGISSVVTATIFFNAQINGQSQNFTLWVNGQSCNTRFYYIATAYSAAGNTQFYFDCSNVITKAGNYTITIRSASVTGVVSGWLDLTYMNSPQAVMQIHGTEYIGDESGKTWVQLVNASGQYIDNAVCQASIFYPDNMPFITMASMSYLDKGIYYYNFIVPESTGIYPISVLCYYTTASQTETADAGAIWTGEQVIGSYTSTATKNNGYWKIDELLTLGTYRLDFIENFTGITQPALMTDASVIWWGKWNGESVGNLNISVYNYTSGQWYVFPNTIPDTDGSNIEISNTISSTNLTASGLLNDGNMVIRITDSTNVDVIKSQIQTDQLIVNLNSLSGDHIENVKGSGEIHVQASDMHHVRIETLCGKEDTSACAIFTDDNEFDQIEGEIEDNITVFALTHEGDMESEWEYRTPYAVDCTAIYWLKLYNGTDWVDVTDTISYSSDASQENCIIKVPITLNPSGVYQEKYYYHIKYDNYMKWEVLYSNDAIKVLNDSLYSFCMEIGAQNGYEFIVPINDTTNLSVPENVLGCERFFDDVWWSTNFFDISQSIMTAGEYVSYLIEGRLYRHMLVDEVATGNFFASTGNSASLAYLINEMEYSHSMLERWDNSSYFKSPTLGVHGTEYTIGDNGTLFVQVDGVNDAVCGAKAYYPNKTIFISNLLSYLNGSNGLYYYDFQAPNTTGVYMVEASCARSFTPANVATYLSQIASQDSLVNSTGVTLYTQTLPTIGIGVTICTDHFFDTRADFGQIASVINVTNIQLWLNTASATRSANLSMDFHKYNIDTNTHTLITSSNPVTASVTTTPTLFTLADTNINANFSASEILAVHVCITNLGGSMDFTLSYGTSVRNSSFTRFVNRYNATQTVQYKGAGEIHVNNWFSNLTANMNSSQLNSILSAIASVNSTLNTTILNYLVTINGTTFQINQSLYDDYISLLAAINSVNMTANQSVSILSGMNHTLVSLSQSQTAYFEQVLAFLRDINYSLNTTIEYKLDLINGTIFQMNDSQTAYYLSLLNAINSVNTSVNNINLSSILSYLMVINDTTYQINSSSFLYYTNILQAINNSNTSQYQQYFDLLNLLYQINQTGNTTMTFVASINQSLLTYYTNLYSFLTNMNLSIMSELTLINNTLVVINGNILNLNSSEFAHYQQMLVLLNDLNYNINTTQELKLDFINSTTWQTLLLLQNLTIGNVSVAANVNWTQGYLETSVLSFSDKINGEGIDLFTETLTCLSNTTLQHLFNGTKCLQGSCFGYNETTSEICQWGCGNNACLPAPPFQYMAAIGFALMVIGGMYVAWRATK